MFSHILSHHGILGINARNLLYVKPFNPKKAIAMADDKLRTKAFLMARGIPAAKIYARIETREQLHAFDFSKLPNECVLKPNSGFGGEGIVILKGRDKQGNFLRSGNAAMLESELTEHIEDILDGKFSLGGRRDTAFFEQILYPHECFTPFRPVGLPDIRVIVFNLVPVMAMLRIPTAESEGKANLHLGGMGIGIDIAKGVTTHAAQYHHMISELPHGGSPSGHQMPQWDDILLVCAKIQHVTNIGYLAVDITIDAQIGPAVLEVNARAGLSVQ
ncbi:MAG: sugar-transfer associated ATP-grasp domain-containing protein, partial [Candidatus Peribacteraceae bacterium]|nr:sugar-transfer associated ATP-grasp domain-containing protein [Candidatus Peribacteraceae bacterium]